MVLRRTTTKHETRDAQRIVASALTEHHRFMLRELLDDLEHTEAKMTTVAREIERRLRPFQSDIDRLCTIPGVDRVTAWGLVSEIGLNMDQFPRRITWPLGRACAQAMQRVPGSD